MFKKYFSSVANCCWNSGPHSRVLIKETFVSFGNPKCLKLFNTSLNITRVTLRSGSMSAWFFEFCFWWAMCTTHYLYATPSSATSHTSKYILNIYSKYIHDIMRCQKKKLWIRAWWWSFMRCFYRLDGGLHDWQSKLKHFSHVWKLQIHQYHMLISLEFLLVSLGAEYFSCTHVWESPSKPLDTCTNSLWVHCATSSDAIPPPRSGTGPHSGKSSQQTWNENKSDWEI